MSTKRAVRSKPGASWRANHKILAAGQVGNMAG